jgi:hypothetical protein
MIARQILKQRGIPYLSLDSIVMGFTNGMPQCGIHDKLFPDEIAERLSPFLEAMCDNMLWAGEDYVIEGEAILPGLARALLDRRPDDIKVCFLGYTEIKVEDKVKETKAYRTGDRDWLMNESDETIHRHLQNMIDYSHKVKEMCASHDVPYFDTSSDFVGGIERATRYLLSVPK